MNDDIPAMDADAVRLARLGRNLRALAASASAHAEARERRFDAELERARAVGSDVRASASNHRPRAAVVCWDLGHNPVGRAYVLYRLLSQDHDVDLIGPMWSRYGSELWEPLRDAGLNVRSFRADRLRRFVPRAEAIVASRCYDLVWVCKPRLPSLYIGAAIKAASGCPMLVDVDDFELSFFPDREYASLEDIAPVAATALDEPYEGLATRYAQSLVASADAVTVSNVALRDRFGGHIVRHARDEDTFVRTAAKRAAARHRLGVADDEFALVFVGTPRMHKGVGEVARALHELADDSIVFHVVGRSDAALDAELVHWPRARVVFHDNCAFSELPAILAGADLVPLIQDPDHPISQHQIPAKVSDALSLGVPVLATATPPLRDLIAQGAITATSRKELASAIAAQRDLSRAGEDRSGAARRAFLGELGTRVNRARLDHAIEAARAACAAQSAPLAAPLAGMLELLRTTYASMRRDDIGDPTADADRSLDADRTPPSTVGPLRARLSGVLRRRREPHDIAFFWKQNDSGLFGRRSDMIVRQLVASPRVGRIAHFDAPLSVHDLTRDLDRLDASGTDPSSLVLRDTVDRQLGLRDAHGLRARTFVGAPELQRSALFGESLPHSDGYAGYVARQLHALGMRPETTVAWFCPVVRDAASLVRNMDFAAVVSDLIDDERAWCTDQVQSRRVDKSYAATLGASDLVFANCLPLAEAMQAHADTPIEVVPNGAERLMSRPMPPRPDALEGIDAPIAGYVGDLRDRIDWLLLHEVVAALPQVEFVLAGPGAESENATSLARHPNVRMVGVVPYSDMPDWLRHFDVGLVPHVHNRLTSRMNPLKIYNYFAAGLPIVSTAIDNITIPREALHIADRAPAFSAGIVAALSQRPDTTSDMWQTTMNEIAWDARVGRMLDLMDARLPRRRQGVAGRAA